MLNSLTLLLFSAFLISCSSVDKQVLISPYPSLVPVAVACAPMMPVEPVWESEHLPVKAGNVDLLKAVLADLSDSRQYNEELKTVLIACQ